MFRHASSTVWGLVVAAVALGSGARAAEPIPARVWDDLASDDPATRASAVAVLQAAGPQAVAFLRERLKPVAADVRRLDALIEQLDSEQFVEREQATEELEYLGKIAQPQLEKALANKPSLEVRRRVEQLLERLQPQVVQRSEQETVRSARSEEEMAARERRPDRRTASDVLRDHPEVVDNPGMKILLEYHGQLMTPRQLIELARKEQASPLRPGPEVLDRVREARPGLAKGARESALPVSRSWVRAAAAVRVLERVGNNEAQEVLQTVAGGAEDALPTVAARSALNRLKASVRP
jgi:hypothetical protein